eukprot:gnl/Chilomastix_cuspidata/2306.p1 GENE.gnl/Chilomastix_cuspidata/2306~~gnl/Chilomastix_cuspidata/2306.p1  ORF type:complete len:500 (-),score=215.20 gnl/Chilomastix_cuspidata/2306:84-1367(-)
MRAAKSRELLKALEQLVEDFDRQVDRRDAALEAAVEHLNEAEAQHRRAQHGHLASVDQLNDILRDALARHQTEFATSAAVIREEFEAELDALCRQHATALEVQRRALAALEQLGARRREAIEADYQDRLDEQETREQESFNVMKLTREAMIEDLDRHFENAHKSYRLKTENLTHNFKVLTIKENRSANTIEKQTDRINQLQRQFAHWRSKLITTVSEFEKRNAALRKEREDVAQHVAQFKRRLQRFRQTQRRRKIRLSSEAHACLDVLGEQERVAQNVLRLAEMTSKLETEAERVRPGACELDAATKREIESEMARVAAPVEPVEEEPEEGVEAKRAAPSDGAVFVAARAARDLRFFNRRLNNALLDKLTLERENMALHDENAQLRAALQQYLDGITVSDQALDRPNALFVTQHVGERTLDQVYHMG